MAIWSLGRGGTLLTSLHGGNCPLTPTSLKRKLILCFLIVSHFSSHKLWSYRCSVMSPHLLCSCLATWQFYRISISRCLKCVSRGTLSFLFLCTQMASYVAWWGSILDRCLKSTATKTSCKMSFLEETKTRKFHIITGIWEYWTNYSSLLSGTSKML